MQQIFTASGILKNIEEQVRFARARFGTYDLVDFVAILIGYAVSAEPSLQAFYERLEPFASAFMDLFGRKCLPHRSTVSRYLAALDQPTVEALRVQPPYRKGDPVGECDREANAPSPREKEVKSRRVGAAGAPAFRLFCQRTSPTSLAHV